MLFWKEPDGLYSWRASQLSGQYLLSSASQVHAHCLWRHCIGRFCKYTHRIQRLIWILGNNFLCEYTVNMVCTYSEDYSWQSAVQMWWGSLCFTQQPRLKSVSNHAGSLILNVHWPLGWCWIVARSIHHLLKSKIAPRISRTFHKPLASQPEPNSGVTWRTDDRPSANWYCPLP